MACLLIELGAETKTKAQPATDRFVEHLLLLHIISRQVLIAQDKLLNLARSRQREGIDSAPDDRGFDRRKVFSTVAVQELRVNEANSCALAGALADGMISSP